MILPAGPKNLGDSIFFRLFEVFSEMADLIPTKVSLAANDVTRTDDVTKATSIWEKY